MLKVLAGASSSSKGETCNLKHMSRNKKAKPWLVLPAVILFKRPLSIHKAQLPKSSHQRPCGTAHWLFTAGNRLCCILKKLPQNSDLPFCPFPQACYKLPLNGLQWMYSPSMRHTLEKDGINLKTWKMNVKGSLETQEKHHIKKKLQHKP